MSFIYSQALEAAFLDANYSGTDPCALLSGSPTPKLSLSHDRTMDASRLSRFGMTCKPLTESRGEELLTWWLEGFPVRTYPSQEKAQELTEPEAECGGTWRGWLAKFDPASSLWKTAQLSLIGDSGESLATFPRSGMTRGGLLWELPTLERTTRETDSGCLLPTPVSIDAGSGRFNTSLGSTNKRPTLALMARKNLWPTPRCQMTRPVKVRQDLEKGHKGNLEEVVAVRSTWTTPTRHNAKETNAPSGSERNTPTLAAQAGGALNPMWTEWLMGWPIGWTALKPLEMDRCQPVPQPHGELLGGLEA